MDAEAALKTQDDKFHNLGLTKAVVNKGQINCYSRALDTASTDNPILVLIHGYPQSAFMWRHLIPLLPPTAPLFVPDVPGYGASPPTPSMDKQTVGTALLSALQSLLNKSTTSPTPTPTPIILIGHDRGARIAHRLAVTGAPDLSLSIKGASLIDIVPTAVQWQHDAGAPTAAAQITGYFHWPFLANVDLAVRMIGAFGPAAWCEEMTLRWAGSHGPGLESLKADEALGVYGAFFAQPRTLRASCEDYKAGAGEDVEAQVRDREKGRRIEVPVLLIYSKDYIGSRYDMGEVWNEWIAEGVKIDKCELGGGVGHFGVEEAPGESAKALRKWIEGLKG